MISQISFFISTDKIKKTTSFQSLGSQKWEKLRKDSKTFTRSVFCLRDRRQKRIKVQFSHLSLSDHRNWIKNPANRLFLAVVLGNLCNFSLNLSNVFLNLEFSIIDLRSWNLFLLFPLNRQKNYFFAQTNVTSTTPRRTLKYRSNLRWLQHFYFLSARRERKNNFIWLRFHSRNESRVLCGWLNLKNSIRVFPLAWIMQRVSVKQR